MSIQIRNMQSKDEKEVLSMMRVFYDSPALAYEIDDEVLKKDFKDCVGSCPFVEGFIFEENQKKREDSGSNGDGDNAKDYWDEHNSGDSGNENKNICGYAMTAMCYSTEFGGLCIWLEDLYIKLEYRHQKIGTHFFEFMEKRYPDAVRFKLEVEQDNSAAIGLYKSRGYGISPYLVMAKEI